MVEQICPVCGCTVEESGYEQEGVLYCCEPCATGSASCQCGCCHVVTDGEEAR